MICAQRKPSAEIQADWIAFQDGTREPKLTPVQDIAFITDDFKMSCETVIPFYGTIVSRRARFGSRLFRCNPETLDLEADDPTASQWLKDIVAYGSAKKKVHKISNMVEFWDNPTNWNTYFVNEATVCGLIAKILHSVAIARAPHFSRRAGDLHVVFPHGRIMNVQLKGLDEFGLGNYLFDVSDHARASDYTFIDIFVFCNLETRIMFLISSQVFKNAGNWKILINGTTNSHLLKYKFDIDVEKDEIKDAFIELAHE